MVITFFRGAILGFSMSVISLGPAFFALIQTSIKNGFRQAAAMAFGIALSDAFFIFLSYLGAAQFLDNPDIKKYEGIGGSIILFVFGIYTLFQKYEDEKDERKGLEVAAKLNKNKRLPWMLVKGFALNTLNPVMFLIWIGVTATVTARYTTRQDVLLFFAGTIGTILTLDILKSLLANRLKKWLTHKILVFIHYIMGIALIISGIVLLYDVFWGKGASA